MTSPLLRAVAVMDRLRSPGGCPWDAAQSHRSLAKYLLEETYETLEAIETDDMALLREELGDLLLQVLFHARLAEELPAAQRFGIDDVAGDLVAKLVHRHPHVFADVPVADAAEVTAVDGVPMGQPALALAAKLVSRAGRAGLDVDVSANDIGDRLLGVVREAVAAGVDPESALRESARALRDALVAAEAP